MDKKNNLSYKTMKVQCVVQRYSRFFEKATCVGCGAKITFNYCRLLNRIMLETRNTRQMKTWKNAAEFCHNCVFFVFLAFIQNKTILNQ
jgi:hypothetical protein